MKKFWAMICAGLFALCISLGFVGCKNKGPIPDGNYAVVSLETMCFEYTEKSVRDPYGFEIEGDTAKCWVSGITDYKAKIVEKDGKIYFEGYKWKELFSSYEHGRETVYEVVYDEDAKTITLTEVK